MTDPNPAPAPNPASAPAPAPDPAATPWHGITDPDAAAYISNKGWTAPADIVKSYQGVEKLIGRDPSTLITMPRLDDPEGVKSVFQKLGLPESPDKYDMSVGLPQGAKPDPNFSKTMQSILHKSNLTDGQAKTLVAEYNALNATLAEQAAKDYELNVQADKQALLDEWKGGHDRMMNRAKTAATTLGFTPELIDAIEKQVGYAGTYKLLAEIGSKLGEDTLITQHKNTDFGTQLTPDEAKSQLATARSDPNHRAAIMDKSHPGNKAAQEKENKLFAIMYPGNK
jgi:hypothetical protein